jgi:hypothetical protein
MAYGYEIALITMLVLFAAVIIFPYVHMTFKDYCYRVAELDERIDEFLSLRTNEGGLNRFEILCLGMLLKRDHLKYRDYKLSALADKVFKLGFVCFALAAPVLSGIIILSV